MIDLDFLKDKRFEPGLTTWRNTPKAILVDVRSPMEFERGHIPHAINIPLQAIQTLEEVVPDKNTPLFIYCKTGTRSAHALLALADLGYLNARNIGGINGYTGSLANKGPEYSEKHYR